MGKVALQHIENMKLIDRTQDTKSNVRLMNVYEAAAYLNVSHWSVRGLIDASILPAVRLPAPRSDGQSMRRLLVDVRDLDDLIESSKQKYE